MPTDLRALLNEIRLRRDPTPLELIEREVGPERSDTLQNEMFTGTFQYRAGQLLAITPMSYVRLVQRLIELESGGAAKTPPPRWPAHGG